MIQEVESKEKENWFKKKNSNYDQFEKEDNDKDLSDLKKQIDELEKKKKQLLEDEKAKEEVFKQAVKDKEAAERTLELEEERLNQARDRAENITFDIKKACEQDGTTVDNLNDVLEADLGKVHQN